MKRSKQLYVYSNLLFQNSNMIFNYYKLLNMDGRFYLLNDKPHIDHILKIKLLFLSTLQQFQF